LWGVGNLDIDVMSDWVAGKSSVVMNSNWFAWFHLVRMDRHPVLPKFRGGVVREDDQWAGLEWRDGELVLGKIN